MRRLRARQKAKAAAAQANPAPPSSEEVTREQHKTGDQASA
jgi:hypothetical protein